MNQSGEALDLLVWQDLACQDVHLWVSSWAPTNKLRWIQEYRLLNELFED